MNTLPYEFIQAEDVSATVAYLASDDARRVTGAQLTVDCGLTNR
jgi:NAD(P)-dependent dehydrogenase (short-subunit alcohol dehydrogenase family)